MSGCGQRAARVLRMLRPPNNADMLTKRGTP